MTQTASGKVRFVPSPQSSVAVMLCMMEPQCEQIRFWDALGASEKVSGLTICGSDFSRVFSTPIRELGHLSCPREGIGFGTD
jgi:hypothetical protein